MPRFHPSANEAVLNVLDIKYYPTYENETKRVRVRCAVSGEYKMSSFE